MLDTALESAHNLSMSQQQNLAGHISQSELDLAPVMGVLDRLDVRERVIAPAALYGRLEELRQKAVSRNTTFGYEEPVASPDGEAQSPSE
jgi:hypothetical protein